jgi:Toastrack DUF4097
MRHYWVLGIVGIGLYGIYEYATGGLWFQRDHERQVTHVYVSESPSSSSSASVVASDTDRDFHWSGSLREGQMIEIKGVNGNVVARPSQGDRVEVSATKTSKRSDLSSVTVQVLQHGDGITVCAMYRSAENECAPGDGGRVGSRNNDVQVNFEIGVPKGVRFAGRTVNGSVKATDLEGDVIAHTVNGSITVSTTGTAEANTVNGSIDASVGQHALLRPLDFQTVNGRITLRLPEGIDAEISGSTSNGSISSDFPITIKGQFGPKRMTGTLGQGGERINLQSVNGTIRIERGG